MSSVLTVTRHVRLTLRTNREIESTDRQWIAAALARQHKGDLWTINVIDLETRYPRATEYVLRDTACDPKILASLVARAYSLCFPVDRFAIDVKTQDPDDPGAPTKCIGWYEFRPDDFSLYLIEDY